MSNGVVYIGSKDNNTYAIDALTGKEKWRFKTDDIVRSSPAVSQGVVYVGSYDYNLYAIDAVIGTEKWRFKTGNYVYSSPVVSNGVIYFGSWDNNLYAIDAVDGKEKWRFKTGWYLESSPAVSNGVVYVGSDDQYLYAIDAVTGKEKWRFKTGDPVLSSPAVSQGVVYVGSYDNNLYAIDAVKGTEKWHFKTGDNVLSSPAVLNGIVYVGSQDNNTYAIDAVTGIEKWRFKAGNSYWGVLSSPAVSNGIIYVGSGDNNTYAIDAVTGKEKWQFKTKDVVYSSPAVSNGVVYFGSYDGNLYAVGEASSIQSAPPSLLPSPLPPSSSGVSNVSLPIILILVVLCIAGGGYAFYRMKNKPSDDQPADGNEIPAIAPTPSLIATSSGKNEEFIHANEKQNELAKEVTELKEKGGKLLAEVESLGIVPEHVRSQLDAQDIPTIQRAITELEAFRTTLKPELKLTLGHTQLIANEWDKLTIHLENSGNANINDIRLIFSDEFDTKFIKPVTIKAGATTSLDIAIRPKIPGKIPLELAVMYRDGNDKEYHETYDFWIDVLEKATATSTPPETPSSPVSQFTPRPLTPKQLPPDLSDRYTESEFIGKGGFARVFKAKRKDGKYVAIKIPIALDSATGKSFVAEIQNWTKLNHTNIVRIYDFNIMPLPYFEMELCDSSLAEMKKPIESEEAAWIIFNVCEGLKFTHAQKIIHRDLKPQNILIKEGTPKISDWGLSRVITESSASTTISFTPHYAAPEQINNRVKDERTDIWQIGVILSELVTGVLPFKGESMVEIGMNIATKDPVPLREIIPGASEIDAVVMKCLQKEPAKRYQSVLELQKDLAMYLRKNYADLLKTSVSAQDSTKSAYYCGDLVMINMLTGDIATAYKYLLDLIHYSKGDVKVEAQELSEQLKMRMEMGVTEIPDELIQKADLIVHQVSIDFKNRG